jgi:hypothetical protein
VVKGEVCKTSMQRFESARRLHFPPARSRLRAPVSIFVFRIDDSQKRIEMSRRIEVPQLVVSSHGLVIDENLRNGSTAGALPDLVLKARVPADVDLFEIDSLGAKQGLGP